MKMSIKNLRIVILLVISCLIFCGCGKEEENETTGEVENKPVALVIIAGRHANAKMYTRQMIEKASEYIRKSFVTTHDNTGYTSTAQVSVIVCDGKPEKVDLVSNGRDIRVYTSGNTTDLNNQKSNFVNELADFLLSDSLKSNDSEVDLLGAIGKAQNILETYPESEHHILILDTGITTAGALDMHKIKIMENSCEDIVELVSDAIPHLDGTYVTFEGLGNVAEPQCEITSTSGQDKLEELWSEILKYGHAELTSELNYNDSENSIIMAYNESNPESYREVSSISFYNSKEPGIEPNPTVINREEKTKEATIAVRLQTSDLGGFVPDKDILMNEDKAIATLNTLSDDLSKFLSETEYKLYVVGSVAKVRPGKDGDLRSDDLAEKRAKTVVNLLIEKYDVPADRMIIINAGTTAFSWRNADEYINNSPVQVDSEAQKNRVVAIISQNSSLVEELRNNGYVE